MRKNMLLLITTLLVLVGSFEVYKNIRYYNWKSRYVTRHGNGKPLLAISSPDNVLIWEYRPYGESGNIKTNRYGFRDYDYDLTNKPGGIYRIAFIGDSVTLGTSTDFDNIFVRRFEIEANKLNIGKKIQALNCSVDGYNTVQICEMLKTKVVNFSPDKVIYVMCLNDFDFDDSSANKQRYFIKPKSFFIDEIERAFKHLILSKMNFYSFHFKRNKEVVFNKILQMKDVMNQKSINYQVVILPIFENSKIDFKDYSLVQIHYEIRGFLIKNKIDFIDLFDRFKEQNEYPRHWAYDDYHLNDIGHKFVTQELLLPVLEEHNKAVQ